MRRTNLSFPAVFRVSLLGTHSLVLTLAPPPPKQKNLLHITAYQKYRQGKSFVVVEGTALQAESLGFEINTRIASMLETPMLLALHSDEYKSTPVSV